MDVAPYRKKSGYPLLEEYTSALFMQQFSLLSSLLQGKNDSENSSDDELFNVQYSLKYCNEYSLSIIIYKIQMFMEEYLGRNSLSNKKQTLTKLPIQVFRNYSAFSSLHIILKMAIELQIQNGWDEFDINSVDRINIGYDLLKNIETKLIQCGMLIRPKIFLNKVPSSIEENLRKIVIEHSGCIVDTLNMATHVVDWDDEVDNLPAELSEEFIRTIDFRPELDGGIALVHWWYYPDCYDEWIPAQDVKDNDPPDINPLIEKDKKWRVCCRYIYDCQMFNEWGNEIDYLLESEDEEYDEDEQEATPVKGVTRGKRGRKRKDTVDIAPKSKKQTLIPESITSTEKMMRYSLAPTSQKKRSNIAFIDVSLGTQSEYSIEQNNNFILGTIEVEDKDENVISPNDTERKKARRAKKAAAILQQSDLPEWFENDKISELEKKYLSMHIFKGLNGSMLEKKEIEYLRIRSYIIVLYAQNPCSYLSATDCRRKITGNVCDILKIHEFLNAFGVINFLVKPELRPIGRSNISSSQLNFNLLKDITCYSDKGISQNMNKIMNKVSTYGNDDYLSKEKLEELKHNVNINFDEENLKKFLQTPLSKQKKHSMNELYIPAYHYSMSRGYTSDKMKALSSILINDSKNNKLEEAITTTRNILKKQSVEVDKIKAEDSILDE